MVDCDLYSQKSTVQEQKFEVGTLSLKINGVFINPLSIKVLIANESGLLEDQKA